MVVFQIIYLALNVIGLVASLIYMFVESDWSIIDNFFSTVTRSLGKIGCFIVGSLGILLFFPAIAVLTAIILFFVLVSTCLDLPKE